MGVWSQVSPFFSRAALDHGIYHRTRRQNRIPAIFHLGPTPGLVSQERVASEHLMVRIYYNIKTWLEQGFYSHEVTETEKPTTKIILPMTLPHQGQEGNKLEDYTWGLKRTTFLSLVPKGFIKPTLHLECILGTLDHCFLEPQFLSLENVDQPRLFHPSGAQMWKYCSKTHVWQVIGFPSPGTCWSTCLVASPSAGICREQTLPSVPVLLTCGRLMLEMPHDAWSIIRFGETGRGRLKTASTASTNLLVSHFRSQFQNNF